MFYNEPTCEASSRLRWDPMVIIGASHSSPSGRWGEEEEERERDGWRKCLVSAYFPTVSLLLCYCIQKNVKKSSGGLKMKRFIFVGSSKITCGFNLKTRIKYIFQLIVKTQTCEEASGYNNDKVYNTTVSSSSHCVSLCAFCLFHF